MRNQQQDRSCDDRNDRRVPSHRDFLAVNDSYRLLKHALLEKYPLCEVCGMRRSEEVNHCLYHKHDGIFDTIENCQAVCHKCHMEGKAHTRENKLAHWKKRKEEGYKMNEWNETVPGYRKEYWE